MFARSQRLITIPFLLPALALLGTFFLFPLGRTFVISLSEYSRTGRSTLVGFENYLGVFGDGDYLNSLRNAILLAVIGGFMLFPPAIAIAWAFHHRLYGERVFRFLIFSPVVLSVAVVALMWTFIFHPTFGLINPTFAAMGLGDLIPVLLGDPRTALPAVAFAAVWHGIGIWIILISAGFARLPGEVIEAARIDGAGEWQIFWRIMLPMMSDLFRVLIVLWFVQSLQAFAFVFIMTGGGPFGSTEITATLMYRTATDQADYGYAAAMGIVLVLILLVVALGLNRLLKRDDLEY
ncbi:carbohydrate ABC transporter permease [Microlunatus parietis]|uniref:ABC-type sugar transport system permease subunit n=1 Tax=Microlunatus parietis TaxID=682979 RepID=A0A7Y9IDW8_9ACTN|nr:sugar ABC transporter permease [Microlunatus parietis]NYE75153.1 ABC-type sugar transport system permease subunit [Microlunatus parietis]